MNTVTLPVSAATPPHPHSCESLAAICGHPIAEIRQAGSIVEIDFSDDWEPDFEDRAILRELLELGC